jgi:hypothetical protein
LDRTKISDFGWRIGNSSYWFSAQTGRFYINGKEANIPLAYQKYFDKPINYAGGLICYIQAYSEQNTVTGVVTQNDFEYFGVGWKMNFGNEKVQIICKILPDETFSFEVGITDLTTETKTNDLFCSIGINTHDTGKKDEQSQNETVKGDLKWDNQQ